METSQQDPATAMEYCEQLDRVVAQHITSFEALAVLPGSPIDEADKMLQYRSYRETVQVPIFSALDHLRLVTKSVPALRGVLPFAHATPLRSAITAASTSLWAMHDEHETRVLRAAILNYYDYSNGLKYFNGRPADKYPDLDRAKDKVRQRMDYFAAELADRGEDVADGRWRPTADFDMVVAAAKMMRPWRDGWKPVTEVPSRWRWLSGYAHGMRWATAPNTEQSEADENGYSATTMTFGIDSLMESARIVQTLIETALDRYSELAGHTEDPDGKSSAPDR
ncbi:hypothetical protein [Rhodococcus jostii]|uniref:hypothetical protein n=1 Tax=Rhodococcus jostii TaxID=132919 RepID=UPI0036679D4B